ncbi:MAG: CTP-dependent riboflavin kinase [Thaumarchaeota archaeon]|jgi:riboflavin kinase|nr:CTP-dependent riboflavin kinase [Nitrososphaerota archaeon]MBT5842302.1 CTP-dependent riboflavin kinase [Nitrososphaerota archaeon]MBT6468981.1 CTP-dependent riboflavin kinase [Nitrososphaerota archaeon]
MTELKIQHILTLSYLLSKGAKHNYVTITTSSLGKNIKKSQQAASKHLLELEQNQFIERIISGRNISVKITSKGFSEMVKLSTILQKSLNSFPSHVEIKGILTSGMGEGAYYMGLKGYTKQFKSKIGYIPFPGTLNLRIDKKIHQEAIKQFVSLNGIMIKSFSDGKRTYGWVKCFPAKLNNSVDCNLILLERTHHDNSVVELISKTSIRKSAKLKDGAKVTIKIPVSS